MCEQRQKKIENGKWGIGGGFVIETYGGGCVQQSLLNPSSINRSQIEKCTENKQDWHSDNCGLL